MILKNGLLDNNIDVIINKKRKEFDKLYQIIFELNDLFLQIINNNIINSFSYDKDIYIYTTLFEIHSSFQSIIILLERGLENNAEILLRSLFEKKFKLFAVIKNDINYKLIIKEKNKEENISTRKWAKYANLLEDYKIYSELSNSVHHNVNTITNLVENKNNIIKINTYSFDNFEKNITIAITNTIQCLIEVLRYKNIKILNKEIKNILRNIKK